MILVARFPIPAVAAVVMHQSRVLLVKRARAPNQHLWTLPGGKLRWGETISQAAEREVREETGLAVKAGQPVHIFEYMDVRAGFHYLIVDLLAQFVSGVARPGDDVEAVDWFDLRALQSTDVEHNTRQLLIRLAKERQVSFVEGVKP